MERRRMPNQTWAMVSVAEDRGRIKAFVQRRPSLKILSWRT